MVFQIIKYSLVNLKGILATVGVHSSQIIFGENFGTFSIITQEIIFSPFPERTKKIGYSTGRK